MRPILSEGPEQRLLAAELAERLGHLLHKLTPRQREVLVLRIAVGLSAEETAQVVGSTPGAVRVTQRRALEPAAGRHRRPARSRPRRPRRHARQRVVGRARLTDPTDHPPTVAHPDIPGVRDRLRVVA